MASAARCLTRSALRLAPRAPSTVARTSRLAQLPRSTIRQQSRRGYASSAPESSGGSGGLIAGLAVLALGGGGGYYYYTQNPEAFAGAAATAKKEVGKQTGAVVTNPT